MFSLLFSRELHGKCDQEGFYHLTYTKPKHQRDECKQLVQIIFSAWFGYLEYVSYLPSGKHRLFSINILISSLSTSTGLPDCVRVSSSEKCPAWKLANHFWHILSVVVPFSYAVQILFQLHFYLSWNDKAQTLKMFFSSIFNTKMSTQTFTNFHVFFFKCMMIWQHLTKLFWMKLKITKHY